MVSPYKWEILEQLRIKWGMMKSSSWNGMNGTGALLARAKCLTYSDINMVTQSSVLCCSVNSYQCPVNSSGSLLYTELCYCNTHHKRDKNEYSFLWISRLPILTMFTDENNLLLIQITDWFFSLGAVQQHDTRRPFCKCMRKHGIHSQIDLTIASSF